MSESEFDEASSLPAPPESVTLEKGSHKWAQDPHVRLIITIAVLGAFAVAYMALGIAVAVGWLSVEEAKELTGAGAFSGLTTIAATVVGYYFGQSK